MHDTHQANRVARPWWIGLGVALMGALWIHGASGIASTTGYVGLGPEAIVFVEGIGLTLLGLILIVQALRGTFTAVAPEDADGDGDADADASAAPASRQALLLALAGMGVPLLTMRWLGFPLTAMLAFTLVARAFGSPRTGRDLVVGALLGSLTWFVFSRLGIGLGAFLPLPG
ncbi:tripartite tricarboxylate transporter TctB family protein [Verminephrobacter aporrectodeae]|uniref:tripartite tricarboxylate transporter TctB family protein n=1 Tax=Verminephrobacter aporrectodeae TaxID=1110389 RepID=UPI0002375AB3|nr:tripartite tricarboxylate transporter TctB family protein [Verminephrobacter aporrectodeae]